MGVRVRNTQAMRHFYVGILGLKPHPDKDNWLGWEGSGYPIHLMAGTELSADGRDHTDLARHFAIEVESLQEMVKLLLSHGLRPFQSGLGIDERRDVTADGDLSYGIGTIFVGDPDGNIVEFVQAGQGIYSKYL